jgi:hypothetical protein
MPVGIEAWITQIPPITRGWLALSILISLAVVGPFGFQALILTNMSIITAM